MPYILAQRRSGRQRRAIITAALGALFCLPVCCISSQAPAVNRAAQDASSAIAQNDTAKLASLLRAGLDPNARTWNGRLLLIWAMDFRSAAATKMLLDVGANPN